MNKVQERLTRDREMFRSLYETIIKQANIAVPLFESQKIQKTIDKWFSPKISQEYEIDGDGDFMERYDFILSEIESIFTNDETGETSKLGEQIIGSLEAHESSFVEYQIIKNREGETGFRFDPRS
jgi:NhaP-type Na+/H+ and K+/H+ antiporter